MKSRFIDLRMKIDYELLFFYFVTANALCGFLYSWAERGTGLTLILN